MVIYNTSYIPAKQVAMTIHESNQQQNNIRRLDSPIPNEQIILIIIMPTIIITINNQIYHHRMISKQIIVIIAI